VPLTAPHEGDPDRICQRLQEGFPHRLIQINVCSAKERALPGRAMFPHGAWFFEL
jgi:hypothetical protein